MLKPWGYPVESELHVHRPKRVLKTYLCQTSAAFSFSAVPTARTEACGRGGHLSAYAGIADCNAVPAHRRHPVAHHGECGDGYTCGCAGVLLPDRWEDEALLRALLVPVRRDWSTLGVVLVLLDDGLRLESGVAQRGAVVMGIVDRGLATHRGRTLVTGIGGMVFGRSSRSSGKVHLWMRCLVIGTDLLRLRALGLIPGRAVWVFSGCGRRGSILVVPLRMLRVRLVVRRGSAHRWNDRGGR